VRFYFDIHYCGKVHADDEGEEFDTIEDARAYVLSTTKEFYRLGQRPNRKVILYARIEITDRQGTSITVPMAGQYCGAHPELPRRQRSNMMCLAGFLGQLNSFASKAATIATIRFPPGSILWSPGGVEPMLRNIILWLAGVPIVVIILLHLFGFLN